MQDQFNLTKATNLGYNLRTYFLSGFLETSQQVISQQVHCKTFNFLDLKILKMGISNQFKENYDI